MTAPQFIGLTGYAGTGKDTVRQILEDEGFEGFAFADPMRGMLREMLGRAGLDDRCMDERALKELPIEDLGLSYRHLAQTLGTEWGRALAPDFWLRLASGYVADTLRFGAACFVVSDVRFANEAAWVRAQGGVIWRIHREGVAPVRAHVSEQELDGIRAEVEIYNDGSLDTLRTTVLDALGERP